MSTRFQFKPLREVDFPLLVSWLAQTHVHRWYHIDGELNLAAVQQQYLARILGDEPVQCFIIFLDQIAIGFIQLYSRQEFTHDVIPFENVAGLDFYIGEPTYLHRGLGAKILTQFLTEIVYPHFESCVVDPDTHNLAAIRCYTHAGFRQMRAGRDGKVLMYIHKP